MIGGFVAFLTVFLFLGQPDTPAPEKTFSSFLQSDGLAYVKMPDVYIGSYGVGTKWSRDSKALLTESLNDRGNVRERRRKIREVGELRDSASVLFRYTVETGQKEVLYRTAAGEGIETREFVGPGPDVLFSVFGSEDGKLVRRIYFAPANGDARPIGPALDIRTSPSVLTSGTQPRALVAVTTSDKRLQVFLISPEASRLLDIPGDWQFAQFTTNTKQGTARIAVSKLDEKEKATGAVLDIDYATGKVTEITPATALYELPVTAPPLFKSELCRTARVASEIETPEIVRDLDLLDEGPKPHRLSFARGIVGEPERSPDGLKAAFQTTHGFFVAELTALTAKASEKKLGP